MKNAEEEVAQKVANAVSELVEEKVKNAEAEKEAVKNCDAIEKKEAVKNGVLSDASARKDSLKNRH